MTINEAVFDKENELQTWTFEHIKKFLPNSYLIPGFQITTISGKSGVPDGFTFDFENREWNLVECELLSHGVWPHIAEQITRFVVALQNPETLRKIRDKLFEHIMENNLVAEVSSLLGSVPERLHQQVELFLESIKPQIVIFIDDVSRDLKDMAQAFDISTKIFRVKKLVVNDKVDYYSPDIQSPIIESEPREEGPSIEFDIIENLGGGKLEASVRTFKAYLLNDGTMVYIKKSRYYPETNNYWYGIGTASLEYVEKYKVTHIVFVMGDFGFVKVPVSVVHKFLKDTTTSKNPDGSIRHYHCYISHGPEPELYITDDRPKYSLAECFRAFD